MVRSRSIGATLAVATAWLAVMPTEAAAQKRQRDRITREEILASPHRDLDLFQVIRALRPRFLEPPPGTRSLGGYAADAVAVYVDGARETSVAALRTLAASALEEVRYLDPTRSENEYGPRASGGALVVTLHKGSRSRPPAASDSTPPTRERAPR